MGEVGLNFIFDSRAVAGFDRSLQTKWLNYREGPRTRVQRFSCSLQAPQQTLIAVGPKASAVATLLLRHSNLLVQALSEDVLR